MAAASYVLPFEKPVVELVSRVRELRELAKSDRALEPELRRLEDKAAKLARELFAVLSPWQKVQLSRHPNRPYTLDYIERIFDRLRRAPRRPLLRRGRRHRRGLRAPARALGHGPRPPEGARREGQREAQLRDAPPRGVPQGAAPLRDGEPLRPARSSRSSIRRAPTPASAPRSAGRARRSARASPPWRARASPSSRRSSARAAAAARWRSASPTASSCSSTAPTASSRPRGARRSSGRTAARPTRRPPA